MIPPLSEQAKRPPAVSLSAASARGSDEMSTVVRRASPILDSDLTPDGDLLLRAAGGAVWAGDLRLADRLAKAAKRRRFDEGNVGVDHEDIVEAFLQGRTGGQNRVRRAKALGLDED